MIPGEGSEPAGRVVELLVKTTKKTGMSASARGQAVAEAWWLAERRFASRETWGWILFWTLIFGQVILLWFLVVE